jgi:hexosaminidase
MQGAYRVRLEISPDKLPREAANPDGYTLVVAPDGAFVVGFDAGGAFYGVMSLLSLLPQGGATVPEACVACNGRART